MSERTDPSHGFVVFDARVVDTTLIAAQGAGATDSSFSQAGSKPGAVARVSGQPLVPVVSGEQGTDLLLRVVQGGYAGVASLLYSIDGGTIYRGWGGPTAMRRWEPIAWSDAVTWDIHDSVVIPSTQEIVVTYGERGTTTLRSATYDPIAKTWTGNGTLATIPEDTLHAVGITVDPTTERLVAVVATSGLDVHVYTSADLGVTWTITSLYAQDDDLPQAVNRCRPAFVNGDLVVLLQRSGSTDIYQYASIDLGNTLRLITSATGVGTEVDVVELADGGAMVLYLAITTSYPSYRVLELAFTPFTDAGETTVEAIAATDLAGVDESGSVTICSRSSASPGIMWAWVWNDDYDVWARLAVVNGPAGSYPTNLSMCASMGEISVISNHVAAPGNEDDSLSRIILSEYSSLEIQSVGASTWMPYDTPDVATDWTHIGTTTGTIASDGTLEISASTQSCRYVFDGGGVSDVEEARFAVQIDSAGSSDAGNNQSATLITGDGSDEYEAQLRMDTDSVSLYDLHGSVEVASAAIDLTVEHEFVLWTPSLGKVSCWYRAMGDVDWTEIATDGTLTGSGAAAGNWSFELGKPTIGNAVMRWRYVVLPYSLGVASTAAALVGRSFGGTPGPLPGLGTATGAGFMSIKGGPATRAETYTIDAAYDYGVEQALPAASPSPVAQWRSEDTSEQTVVWDLGDSSWIGDALALHIEGANFRTAYLESYNGATWDTWGTWDGATGSIGLTYIRVGDTIYPGTTGLTADEYFQPGEYEDGLALLPSGKARTIETSSGGSWTATGTTTTVAPKLRLDIDGTEAASGVVTLCRPSGTLIAYMTAHQSARYWRVRIPAQDTASGDFRAGVIGLGRLVPISSWGWGWTQTDQPQFDATKSKAGTERRTKTGETVRTWSFGWTDGHTIQPLRDTVDLDYLGINGGLPLTPDADIWMQMRAVIEDTNSYTIAVVALSDVSIIGTGMVTDPTTFLYGYLSGSVSSTMVVGTEGTDEVVRVSTVTVQGIP
jgi:hypothetical protein